MFDQNCTDYQLAEAVIQISVIICTHNPRVDYLRRVLDALKSQTLPTVQWELLLIDNASKEPLVDKWDLSWHPNGRLLTESKLGLIHARVCGMREAKGKLLVWFDDDNVAEPCFLAEARSIYVTFPQIGVFGGSVEGQFEKAPAQWLRPWLAVLALRHVDRPIWASFPVRYDPMPNGAGMCMRHEVRDGFLSNTQLTSRLELGRRGQDFSGGEDWDIAFTACSMGYGIGVFPNLKLQHLIPASRVEMGYLKKIVAGSMKSEIIVFSVRRLTHPCDAGYLITLLKAVRNAVQESPRLWPLHWARLHGMLSGICAARRLSRPPPPNRSSA